MKLTDYLRRAGYRHERPEWVGLLINDQRNTPVPITGQEVAKVLYKADGQAALAVRENHQLLWRIGTVEVINGKLVFS